ncbi:hypothetical protein BABINDRAFT_161690 [Babjeviella inositovora NRRL Y-12698]|uniref:Uncharacterized protein n=1 Tax=Babjeviella inositovora NRRL Y-12698 TaxID=984486 RepID=A0A1E3QQT4_9ASCO|nr:uncharacterized protein BABINDRAFT_161690 [Babjeviella inositovora NRRL Y-12698]ODQ80049.1 hypothetical protein BABINDRAFT_161690 [Babjeviella inositovora NRRL Y-12698]
MSSLEELVAHYLKEKNLLHTLAAYQAETDIDFDFEEISANPAFERLESIIHDRKMFTTLSDDVVGLLVSAKLHPLAYKLFGTNAMATSVSQHQPVIKYNSNTEPLHRMEFGALIISASVTQMVLDAQSLPVMILTLANKQTVLVNMNTNKELLVMASTCVTKVAKGITGTNSFVCCGMDGILRLYEVEKEQGYLAILKLEQQLHQRLVIDFKVIPLRGSIYSLASIGWDRFVNQWTLNLTELNIVMVASNKLLSIPTCLEFVEHKGHQVVCVCRMDSTFVEIYSGTADTTLPLVYKISLNDAEFSVNDFSPMSITATSAGSDVLLAVGTNHIPYMRMIVVSLQNFDAFISQPVSKEAQSLVSNAGNISRQEIIHNYNTMCSQDKYSSPSIKFSPSVRLTDKHYHHVYIGNCDDGLLRLINLLTGKVKEIGRNLTDAVKHKGKLKCFDVYEHAGEDRIVSCGTDLKVLTW